MIKEDKIYKVVESLHMDEANLRCHPKHHDLKLVSPEGATHRRAFDGKCIRRLVRFIRFKNLGKVSGHELFNTPYKRENGCLIRKDDI